MPTLPTWAGKSSFSYTGSVEQGTSITYSSGHAKVSAAQYAALLKHFAGKTVNIGTSRTDAPAGSVGEWLQKNVTKTAIASYVGSILVEGKKYAEHAGGAYIKFR